MVFFTSKKNSCAICGGVVPQTFARRIENMSLCSDCNNRIDMDPNIQYQLTLQKIREHFVYLDENQTLCNKFVISKKFDFGFLSQKVIFDLEHKFFCMSAQPNKMVFLGSQVKSLLIREDQDPLLEVSAQGFNRYISKVPERVAILTPQLAMIKMREERAKGQVLDEDNYYRPRLDLPKPFEEFIVELKLDHPYWQSIEFSVSGPNFSTAYPDVNSYLQDYDELAANLEELALYLKEISFPEVEEKLVGAKSPILSTSFEERFMDSFEKLLRFKGLLDEGLITEEEFGAMKKQLLGIQ